MADPEKIGKYEVVERIGAGGCGVVYRARDPYIQREVAIKVCISHDDQQRKRFFREAQVIGSLNHPAIISIFDFGFENSNPFLVEELLSGEDLGTLIRTKRPISLSSKLDYLVQVAEALLFAHHAGVLHRDIKPSNVQVLEDGQVKLMDFGVARLLEDEESRLTRQGVLLGTMGYMAPEQIRGLKPDRRADIFSFGALAYELLTYERPFPVEDLTRMIRAVLQDEPTPITERFPECPPALAHLVNKCLEKECARRYGGFEEVLAEFRTLRGQTLDSVAIAPPDEAPAAEEPSPNGPSAAKTVVLEEGAPTAERADKPSSAQLPLGASADETGATVADFELRRFGADAAKAPLSAEYRAVAAARVRPKSRYSLLAALALGFLASLALWLGWNRLLGRADGPAKATEPDSAERGAAVPIHATLEVVSTPTGAAVWMNGENLALTTPTRLSLAGPPGEAVHLELRREGEVLATREFTLGPELPARWEAALPPAPVPFRITSQPEGAKISLDGQATEQVTPATIELDAQARHELRLELEGYRPASLSFELADLTEEQRRRSELYFPLKRVIPPGFLLVNAPYPLRLQVGGRRFDVTGRREISLPPGSHAVRLSAPRVFFSHRVEITVRSGRRTQIPLPPAVEIRVMANPSRCRLRIDGRAVDWLPVDVRLVVGRHEFEFLWESLGRSQKLTREIRADSQRLFVSADDPG